MMKGRSLLALTALILGVSCDGPERATGIRGVPDASEVIADGAHGGNPDFFFLPPMVPPPFQHPAFEPGKFNPRLQASLKIDICELAREPLDVNQSETRPTSTTPCAAKPLVKTFAPGSVDLVGVPSQQSGWWSNFNLPSDGFYKALWDTRLSDLSLDKYYRIKVLIDGSAVPLGYADVDPVSNMREWKHVLTGELVALIDDTKLPIVFRVEKSALCPGVSLCTSATVTNVNPDGSGSQILRVEGNNGPIAGVLLPDGWLPPPPGPQSVVFTISRVNTGVNDPTAGTQANPCHSNLPLQQFNGCFHYSTIPELEPIDPETGRQFAIPITAAVCFTLVDSNDPRVPFIQLWSSEPDGREAPKPLPSADASLILTNPAAANCGDNLNTAVAPSGVMGLASAAWGKLTGRIGRLFSVQTAYAVDLGIGGILDDISNLGPAMSAQIQAYTGTALTLAPGVTTTSTARIVGTQVHGRGSALTTGIGGMPVTFTVASGNGTLNALGTTGGTATQVTVVTNTNPIDGGAVSGGGFAPVNWTLPTVPGTYTLTATGRARGGPITFTATVAEPVIPNPVLAFTGTELYSVNENNFVRYNLAVTNWQSYPAAMFAPAPELPPCGLNTNSSRTWVNIYNASNDSYIYGFCALGTPSNLQSIWFAEPAGTAPPSQVYITLVDRATGVTYRSNNVSPTGGGQIN